MKQHPVKPSQDGQRSDEKHSAVGVGSPPEHAQPAERSNAYDKIDRYLRNNLDDTDYAEFSDALELVWAAPPEHADLLGEAREALNYVLGPKDDPLIGWRGIGGTTDQFQCELCGALHEDSAAIAHNSRCPVTRARAALARIDTVLNREPQQ